MKLGYRSDAGETRMMHVSENVECVLARILPVSCGILDAAVARSAA
jgi:hypothetical protein